MNKGKSWKNENIGWGLHSWAMFCLSWCPTLFVLIQKLPRIWVRSWGGASVPPFPTFPVISFPCFSPFSSKRSNTLQFYKTFTHAYREQDLLGLSLRNSCETLRHPSHFSFSRIYQKWNRAQPEKNIFTSHPLNYIPVFSFKEFRQACGLIHHTWEKHDKTIIRSS